MKKSNLILVSSLATLLGIGLVSNVNADNVWHAKTPSEIGNLNSDGTYTVREGDTIWAIGMRFNVKPDVIETINKINDPYTLQIGTILKINVEDHGNKAVLSVDNGQETTQATLNNSDKIDKNKSFGEKVTPNEASKAQKEKNFNSASSVKVTEKQNNNTTNESRKIATSSNSTATNSSSLQNQVNSNVATNDKLPSQDVIEMLAYVNAYNGSSNVASQDIMFLDGAIGQGTSDSTGIMTMNGNTISVKFPTETITYNINDLVNEYYSTPAQQQTINNLVNIAKQNGANATSIAK